MFYTMIPLYGIFILFAVSAGLFVAYKNSKSLNLNKEGSIVLFVYILLGIVYGAKYFSFLSNYQKYDGVFDFWKVGLSSYGAVIGILLMLFIYSRQFKKKFIDLIYIFSSSIPLMYGIGKLGCFFAGCCYGMKYSGPFSVVYNYSNSVIKGVELFPVQLLEAVIFISIFIYINNKSKNKKVDKIIVIGQTFVISGVAKFLLEYFRFNTMSSLLSINQLVSILFIFMGLIFLFYKNGLKVSKK